jgi:hypothetical protein
MRHLDDVELVDWIDRALPQSRAAHLDACAACRERADALRQELERLQTASSDVPEPSPLFWTHFSHRVHDAVCELPEPPDRAAWFRPAYWTAAAAAVVLAAIAIAWNVGRSAPPADTRLASAPTESAAPLSDPSNINLDEDEEWALVRIMADDVQWEDAQEAGLTVSPGSAERVALELSSAERQELARLLTQLLTPNS